MMSFAGNGLRVFAMHEHVRDYLANDDVARGSANGAFKVEPIRQMFPCKAGELVEGFYQIACDDDDRRIDPGRLS